MKGELLGKTFSYVGNTLSHPLSRLVTIASEKGDVDAGPGLPLWYSLS